MRTFKTPLKFRLSARPPSPQVWEHSALNAVIYTVCMWHVQLQANCQRKWGRLSEVLCFPTTLVSIQRNVAALWGFMFMHDWGPELRSVLAQREKHDGSVGVEGRGEAVNPTPNVLPVHLIHIKVHYPGRPRRLHPFLCSSRGSGVPRSWLRVSVLPVGPCDVDH